MKNCPNNCEHIHTEARPFTECGDAYNEDMGLYVEQRCNDCYAYRYGVAGVWVNSDGEVVAGRTMFDPWVSNGEEVDEYADCEGCDSINCEYEAA